MMRQILLATCVLFMISSIHSLSPAEKIITRGSSSFPSSQNTQDVSLMTSAKALLAEAQSASDQEPHDGEIGSLRKKRAVSGESTDNDYKRFSGFKVVSTPSFSIDITEDIYEVIHFMNSCNWFLNICEIYREDSALKLLETVCWQVLELMFVATRLPSFRKWTGKTRTNWWRKGLP